MPPDCGRRPGSDDELASLGLDSVPRRPAQLSDPGKGGSEGWSGHDLRAELYLDRTGTKYRSGHRLVRPARRANLRRSAEAAIGREFASRSERGGGRGIEVPTEEREFLGV